MKEEPKFTEAIEQAITAWTSLHGAAAVRACASQHPIAELIVATRTTAEVEEASKRMAMMLLMREAGRKLRAALDVAHANGAPISYKEHLIQHSIETLFREVDDRATTHTEVEVVGAPAAEPGERMTKSCLHCELGEVLDLWARQHGEKTARITNADSFDPADSEEYRIALLRAVGLAMLLGSELGAVVSLAPSADDARETLAGLRRTLGDAIPSSVAAAIGKDAPLVVGKDLDFFIHAMKVAR